MLVELSVENVAIIAKASLAPGPGFSVLTGETGAGKSLLVDAIELALGERADSELVRTGAAKASVSAVFDLSSKPGLLRRCEDLGIPLEDGALFISREVFAEGRSQCRVGGRPVPVSALKELGRSLVDLHGQHDHQSLLDAGRHLGFLDDWIGDPANALLARLAVIHERVQDSRRRLSALREGLRDREHRLDLLRFQVAEIEAVDPQPGEADELQALLDRLRNVERLAGAAATAHASVTGEDGGAADGLRAALKAIEDVIGFDPLLERVAERLRSALIEMEEGARELAAYREGLDSDPGRLEEVAERLDALRRLRRKYGEDEAAVLAFLEKARSELALLSDEGATEEDLAAELAAAEAEMSAASQELSKLRRQKATEFSEVVQSELRDLAMPRAEFSVDFKLKAADASGCDAVEFFFSANAGETPRPLSKIASGGEISRVMLAIKTAMSGRAGVPTLIFDEVDAGLGGRAAATVGRKLEELARHYQVLVISHLPQIAARATGHFRIEKSESAGRVTTEVRSLSVDERVAEIARMLAGEHVTESALAMARDLMV